MHADIALADGSEDGVGQRVERRVGIGMAMEFRGVRNFDAAQDHMIARLEDMEVDALAHADIGQFGQRPDRELAVRQSDVLGERELAVFGAARNDGDFEPGALGNRRVVGESRVARGMGVAMGGADFLEAESLRRLGGPHGVARHCLR